MVFFIGILRREWGGARYREGLLTTSCQERSDPVSEAPCRNNSGEARRFHHRGKEEEEK
jgi:hypothetical protein